MVQLSHSYVITGKTITLTRWTFVGKVMSLLFTMLSRLFIAFLPRSKFLLISWLQSSSAVILEPKKIKSLTVSIVSHNCRSTERLLYQSSSQSVLEVNERDISISCWMWGPPWDLLGDRIWWSGPQHPLVGMGMRESGGQLSPGPGELFVLFVFQEY